MKKLMLLIPARGGSKGIPRKNLAPCAGHPLIHWTITAALEADCGDVVVSTEDQEIASVAAQYGVTVLARPHELATDEAHGMDVALHAARWGACQGHDYLAYLQPTSPLRTAEDIRTGWGLMRGWDPVVAITERREVLHASLEEGRLRVEGHRGNRQRVKAPWSVCGAFYGAPIETLCGSRTWYLDSTLGLLIPNDRALDIDRPWDLHLADMILREREHDKGDR